jgi:hypothetical protein
VSRPGRVLLYAAEDALHVVRRRLEGICAAAACELAVTRRQPHWHHEYRRQRKRRRRDRERDAVSLKDRGLASRCAYAEDRTSLTDSNIEQGTFYCATCAKKRVALRLARRDLRSKCSNCRGVHNARTHIPVGSAAEGGTDSLMLQAKVAEPGAFPPKEY